MLLNRQYPSGILLAIMGGRHLHAYASEMAWREDHRRVSNGDQYGATAALAIRTAGIGAATGNGGRDEKRTRSEEHTSELQSRPYLLCRLLLVKKKKKQSSSRERDQ